MNEANNTASIFLADPANHTLTRDQKEFLKHKTFHGNEIVPSTPLT